MGVCFCPSFKNMHLCASGIAQVTLLTLLLMVFSNGFLEVVPQDILNTCCSFTQKHIVNYLAFQPRLMDVLPSSSISSSSAPLNFNQKMSDIGELETKCLRVCEAQVLFLPSAWRDWNHIQVFRVFQGFFPSSCAPKRNLDLKVYNLGIICARTQTPPTPNMSR